MFFVGRAHAGTLNALARRGVKAYDYGVSTTVRECSICRKSVAPRAENPAYPFCSKRCRMVDLGRWLGEEYRVPDRQSDEQEDELPADQHPERGGDA
ncbi:DNA gyrase inhibitor YacG [Archangium violaceum]|nr:DNA gyrase inhibitor YacG [Archangium violaceum]